jgi:predicted rRNA methylase YqxC with S4 and FtsJ domains
MSNRITKRDIIEAVTFILMTVSIIGMITILHQLNEVHKDIKQIKVIRNIK